MPRLIGHGRALDLIMTGRTVETFEAVTMGLVSRLTQPGAALDVAIELAEEIAGKTQTSLRSDRLSSYEAWGLSGQEALRNEHERALPALTSGEAVEGAGRFEGGAGRHGDSAT